MAVNNAVLTILNSTITANTSEVGGAVSNSGESTIVFRNTIVIGNVSVAGNEFPADVFGEFTEVASIVGVPAADVPGILDSAGLGDHGGPTETVALVDSPTNPAVDHGDAATCTDDPISSVDQRGLPRVAPCDIGAYEIQP